MKKRERAQEAIEALDAELGRLRTELHEVADTLVTNLEAEIVQLGSSVAELQGDLTDDGPIRQMIAEIRNLRIKPEKGRRKDLKRIDDLVDRLETIVQEIE